MKFYLSFLCIGFLLGCSQKTNTQMISSDNPVVNTIVSQTGQEIAPPPITTTSHEKRFPFQD